MPAAPYVTPLLALLLTAGSAAAGQLEAYPIPTSADISVGVDSQGQKARPVPAPSGEALTVVAARNAVANGQILLKAKGEPVRTSVTVSDLKGPGAASIPAGRVQVRYGQYITAEKSLSVYRWQKDIALSANAADDKPAAYNISRGLWRIDCLVPTAECEVEENLPRSAWLTFHIARDAAPGVYKGTATVAGADATIPIELEVVDAVVPDLAESVMTNDIRPMWEVIALGNGIPLADCWKSEKFWSVVAAYLDKLGRLRMSSCGISLVAPSTTSSLGMVEWIRKGDRWSWDYAPLDRFIATYRKAVGEPRLLDATAFAQDEQRPVLCVVYTDGQTGERALLQMGDDAAAADLAVAFVKGLTAHLATLKLDKKLALGIWHDKMRHQGGGIRRRLLEEFPDLKLSLWAHSDGWGMRVEERVASYMTKCSLGEAHPYPIKIGMRPAAERSHTFGPIVWDGAVRNRVGLGQVDFANWSGQRRAKEYTYFGTGPFTSWQRHLVYPMHDGQVVTGVLYELFREYSQDFELLKMMQAKGVKSGFLADPRAALNTISQLGRFGRLNARSAPPAKVDRMHWDILRQAGEAKVRPRGKRVD